MARKRKNEPVDPNEAAFTAAWRGLSAHPMFRPLTDRLGLPNAHAQLVTDSELAYARIDGRGAIRANRGHRLEVAEWTWVLAHCLLHLGFGHLDPGRGSDPAATSAACVAVSRFQRAVKLGREPVALPAELPNDDETALASRWRAQGLPAEFEECGVGGAFSDLDPLVLRDDPQWPERFAYGLASAATAAVDVAGGGGGGARGPWDRALSWFVGSYPLLGALAARFKLVADASLARDWQIAIAAVSPAAGEIYVNPLARFTEAQWRFVLAHEMLHAALRHGDRVGPRDPRLWNAACDYVINGWLIEMGVGEMPDGLLHDPALAGASAEEVYDRMAQDLRMMRRLSRYRSDLLGEPLPWGGAKAGGVDLDDYYRRALLTGFAYHTRDERGLLPSGLVAEIRVLEHPPPPWDVRLAQWFDEHVPAPERRRSYSRPSRRQAGTPGIPRPGWYTPEDVERRCTFGVVVDTSGSMNHELLGKALGAIASYANARAVPAARVVFCDAAAYDAGYLAVDDIAGRVRVRGRGGTVLQPGVDLLQRAEDFPATGPILIVTDTYCEDSLRIRRTHAFLVPRGRRLPFPPRGPVFDLR
jgi:predicted metal-dependent peptidase